MMDMDGSPYSFVPVFCDDCGRESGQYFRGQEDDEGTIICIDCLLERLSQWKNEQEAEKEEGDDD
jgi:hypothetical protein